MLQLHNFRKEYMFLLNSQAQIKDFGLIIQSKLVLNFPLIILININGNFVHHEIYRL